MVALSPLAAAAAPKDQIDYDSNTRERTISLNAHLMQTVNCVARFTDTSLAQGVRSRSKIKERTRICGSVIPPDLMDPVRVHMLTDNLTDKEIDEAEATAGMLR